MVRRALPLLAATGVSLLVAALMILLGPAEGQGLYILFVYAWGILLIVAHECGHVLAAGLAGLRVFWVMIGIGRPLATCRVGGIRVSDDLPF